MVFHVGKFIPFMDPMATYPPEKLTVRPWKLGFPTRTFHLPTIHFQVQAVSFREGAPPKINMSPKKGLIQ